MMDRTVLDDTIRTVEHTSCLSDEARDRLLAKLQLLKDAVCRPACALARCESRVCGPVHPDPADPNPDCACRRMARSLFTPAAPGGADDGDDGDGNDGHATAVSRSR